MRTRINRLADRLLGLFLGELEAGACVPEHGDLLWRIACGGCGCTSDGRYRRKDCRCRVSCNGPCVDTGETRCVRTQALC